MRNAWVAIFVGLTCLLVGACLSGQTGSPDCVGQTSCVCDPLYGAGALLRVHAEGLESGKLVAVIDEVFPSSFPNVESLAPGDRVGGSAEVGPPCAHDAGTVITSGSELLVLYSAGFRRDGVAREAALLDGFFAWTTPWTEPLVFGDSKELAQSELGVMQSPKACLEHFPALPAPPCQDTISGACSTTRPGSPTNAAPAWPLSLALFGFFALLYTARRKTCSR